MQYIILISSNDSIEVKEYSGYQTINDLVEGYYERCGAFGVREKMTFLFCNEEFLLRDELLFNAVGTALADQPIYGNVVMLQDGYNEDNERDALPFEKADADKICKALCDFKIRYKVLLRALHRHYDNNKPKPTAQIITMSEDSFRELCDE